MNTYLFTLLKNTYKILIHKTKANCKAIGQESRLQKETIRFEMVTIHRSCKKKWQLYKNLFSQRYNQEEALTC